MIIVAKLLNKILQAEFHIKFTLKNPTLTLWDLSPGCKNDSMYENQ